MQRKVVSAIESLGRQLILVNFGSSSQKYLFPNEIVAESGALAEWPVLLAETLAAKNASYAKK